MAETGRYMYAVCRGLDPRDIRNVTGLKGGRLDLVHHQDLAAVVSTVDLDEYGEEGLRKNLEDLAWLEEAARSHDAVIQTLARRAPTAPLRLATICLDDAGVLQRLREWYHALAQVLDRITGRMEWSVKVFALPQRTPVSAVSVPASASAASGAEYLRRKRGETEERLAHEAAAAEVAARVHEVLSGHAVASRQLPAQDPRLTGHQGTMLLNGAYLVPAEDTAAFAAAAEALTPDSGDVVLDCRGPWPPYSFAMLDQR